MTRNSKSLLLAVKKSHFSARVMARTVQLLRHNAYCPMNMALYPCQNVALRCKHIALCAITHTPSINVAVTNVSCKRRKVGFKI